MSKKLHNGKLYLLSNSSWNHLKKIGVAEHPISRIKSMQTGLPEDIIILYESIDLLDKFFYDPEGVHNLLTNHVTNICYLKYFLNLDIVKIANSTK